MQRKGAILNTYDQVRRQIEDKEKIRELEKQISSVERD
jgi:hypothetical protein